MMSIQSQFTFISLCRSFLRMLRGQYVSIGAEWWSWKSHLSCSSGWDSMSPGQVSSSNHLFKDTLCTTLFLSRNWKVFFLGNNYFSLQKKVSPWYELVFLIPIFFWTFGISYRAFCSKKPHGSRFVLFFRPCWTTTESEEQETTKGGSSKSIAHQLRSIY